MRKSYLTILLIAALLPVAYCQSLDTTLAEANDRAQKTTLFVPKVRTRRLISNSPKDQQLYALAEYLFNMHLYDRHKSLAAGPLSLQHIGVLDPFYKLEKPLTRSDAKEWFYSEEDSRTIYNYLNQFVRESGQPAILFNSQRIEQYLQRFEETAFYGIKDPHDRQKYPAYIKPQQLNWNTPITTEDQSVLLPIWRAANKRAQDKVVIFEQKPELNIDQPLAHNPPQYYYRWVKDECAYSSYLIGKQLLFQQKQGVSLLQNSRIYTITARDAHSATLIPASGQARFQLANGEQGLKWEYHTAILILVATQEPQQYRPIVLDNFLGGTRLMPLEEWAAYFANSTYFQVIPFQTDEAYDKAIADVQRQYGSTIRANDRNCSPYPVNK